MGMWTWSPAANQVQQGRQPVVEAGARRPPNQDFVAQRSCWDQWRPQQYPLASWSAWSAPTRAASSRSTATADTGSADAAKAPSTGNAGTEPAKAKPQGQRMRLRRSKSDLSNSSESSSSPSSSSSSEETKVIKKQRQKWDVVERLTRPLAPPHAYLPYLGVSRKRSFMFVPGLLDEQGINRVHNAHRNPLTREIKDRKNSLNYRHVAYRVEAAMRSSCPALHDRLLEVMAWVDATTWEQLPSAKAVYPEIEYIVYDARFGEPGTIEPHVDNYSVVTMVCLLSHQSDFVGGVNCFASTGERGAPVREVALRHGDAVFFRGEKLTHWITPVTGGIRTILQIELSRV